MKKHLNISLQNDLYEKLTKLKEKNHKNYTVLIETALNEYYKDKFKKLNKTLFSLYLDEWLANKLHEIAEVNRVEVLNWCVYVLEKYVESVEKRKSRDGGNGGNSNDGGSIEDHPLHPQPNTTQPTQPPVLGSGIEE